MMGNSYLIFFELVKTRCINSHSKHTVMAKYFCNRNKEQVTRLFRLAVSA